MKFESNIKEVQYSQERVYDKLSDMNNLSGLIEKLQDPVVKEKLKEQIPEEKLNSVQGYLDSMKLDSDSVSVNVAPIGELGFKIIDKQPSKCVKFASTNSPVGLKMWIQVVPTSETSSKLKLTVDADVNPFIAAMVSKPLKDGVERMADVLSLMPY